jgi:hypothetical protein
MKAIWLLMIIVAATLGLNALIVFGLGDRQILVSPPEAKVEGFVRELNTKRYERALPYLSDELATHVDVDKLKTLTARLKGRVGEIADVRGEPGWMKGDKAEATAEMETERAGTVTLKFGLTRQQGEWAIDGLNDLRLQGS